ncbi:MAG: PBSX family phage terminase large subunit, partial [Lachnospiraceae bacterium]|nr:PBSX family phage terminase large subunit [Lachnospiraceae bacterium]
IWVCVKEYYYSGRDKNIQKTDIEYANDLIKFIDGIKIRAVIVDPSAASFIAQLKKQGFHVKKAKNDVLDGIRLVGTLLNLCKIKFYAECENTIREFASYVWDNKAVERGEDKPLKQADHAMDAVRYFAMTVIKIKQAIKILK